ncbi:hypothetical protein IQ254_16185 [Nodosilinea sp. LEGE 07088]|uniref:hypothetical protein n=1 Tax=Nodosilinea sp. LEGE 07088 TaxID=2777968 RepID=UPI00187EA5CC|nr:hypothetical protein [Nodosilinea sp. LEGE 07088]MBE9138713.1 hypothetical protein [Nodosilinea sp. LEGE 07088]
MVGELVKTITSQLKSGLLRARAASKLSEDQFCVLPQVWDLAVRQRLQDLPLPNTYLIAVAEQVTEAVTTWQTTLDAPNSLVLLGTPVDDTGAVLTAALEERAPELTQRWRILRPLDWITRPADPLSIKGQLAKALEQLKESEEDDGEDDLDDLSRRLTVIVLPPLEQCFLRCIGGWQGVEWLRDTVGTQRDYFWLIPCNTWAWAFLNRVCQVEAYLNQIADLPRLDSDSLSDWLTPFAETLTNSPADEDLSTSALGNISWSNLAELSGGSPEVARLLWLRSLRLQETDRPAQPQPLEAGDALPVPLYQVQPSLPSLPDLDALDYYLVHALMLHGITLRSQLALSLGQSESIVHLCGQTLRQSGVLRLSRQGLSIQPIHYPRLTTELDSNNFLTGDDR